MVRYASLAVAALFVTAMSTPSMATPPLQETGTPTVVTVNGSGCSPNDPLPAELSVIGRDWMITYFGTSMVAEAGPGIAGTASRKNCQLNLAVQMPKDYVYAVKTINMAGASSIASSHTARVSLSTYFQGRGTTKKIDYDLKGGSSNMFHHETTIPDNELNWSECGVDRNLNLNTSLQVDAKGDKTGKSWVRQDQGGGLRVAIVTKKC